MGVLVSIIRNLPIGKTYESWIDTTLLSTNTKARAIIETRKGVGVSNGSDGSRLPGGAETGNSTSAEHGRETECRKRHVVARPPVRLPPAWRPRGPRPADRGLPAARTADRAAARRAGRA